MTAHGGAASGEPLVVIPAAGRALRLGNRALDRPKSLLDIAGRSILERGLRALETRGYRDAVLVIGHRREQMIEHVERRRGPLRVRCVTSWDYATTEHGYSVFQAREAWLERQGPLVLVDADNVYNPRVLDLVAGPPSPNIVLVDPSRQSATREEELILGTDGAVTGFVRARTPEHADWVGEFVGFCRFSADTARALFTLMAEVFDAEGRMHKYERLLHRLVRSGDARLDYASVGELEWVNVNHEEDYVRAEALARRLDAGEHG